MAKIFNVNGACRPAKHYMVNLEARLEEIKGMVDAGKYFAINRARQFGKTTVLKALVEFLGEDYVAVSLDFQQLGAASFETENVFSLAFIRIFLRMLRRNVSAGSFLMALNRMERNAEEKGSKYVLLDLFEDLSDFCRASEKPVVLLVDEVDSATNNQVFLDFLAQLRAYYLDSDGAPAFQSVILAGVYDIRNIRRKLRPDEEHKYNSPWNIAAKFDLDMSFSAKEIAGMLEQYEADCRTGMDFKRIAELMYEYTFGYPYLVSGLCKILDEELPGSKDFPDKSSAWTEKGFYEAEKILVKEDNTLYESLIGKLELFPELRSMLYDLLFQGKEVPYVATNAYIKDAAMFGFIRNENDRAVIFNRIFEGVLYNHFISEDAVTNKMYHVGQQEKNQFILGGHLDMRRVLERFIETFHELYGEENEDFLENVGRKYFILFLKPIINGIGNYSIEPRTRDNGRMDLVIYYRGEQHILELKIWRGNAYNERGEQQLSRYLDFYHIKKGYMLSFNFNKKKEIGMKEIILGDKLLIEAVV